MNRGVSFEIPNSYGNHLGEILKPIDITTFSWFIGGEESYFIVDDTLGVVSFQTWLLEWMEKILKRLLITTSTT